MIDLERPVSRGENIRKALMAVKTKLEELADQNPRLSNSRAQLNEPAVGELNDYLHSHDFLPTDVDLSGTNLTLYDFRYGLIDDSITATLWMDLALPELQGYTGRRIGQPNVRVDIGSCSTYPFPPFEMRGAFACDISDDRYNPELRSRVLGRLAQIQDRFRSYQETDQKPVVDLFDFASGLINPEKATSLPAPFGNGPARLDPKDFPYGLP